MLDDTPCKYSLDVLIMGRILSSTFKIKMKANEEIGSVNPLPVHAL